jgi:pimeloyl-ACP methyl ester carboxylesterase
MVPTAPNAKGFFGTEAKVVSDWIDGLPRQDGDLPWGKILFAGISNGGTAALEHAALRPDRTAGVLAVPGLVGASAELAKLSGLRILIRVGERDELGWARAYESQVRALMRIGASVDARLLPDTPHAFRPPWDDIDGWLALLGTDSLPAAPGIVSAVDAEIRTWRARSGDAVAATLHEEQGPMVALRKPDGETVRIAVANLSREDQWWLEDRREKRQTAVTPTFGFGDSGGGGTHMGPTRPRVTPPVVRFPSDR